MESYFNNKGIFKLLTKWKYHILFIVIISIIASAIFSSSYFIKPKFKSEAVVYPVNLGEYSEESNSEQMQQILLSQDVKDNVIDKLSLDNHYGIDTTYKYYLSTLYFEYGKNIKINKTEFESIRITALDVNPQIACDIVNSILEFYNAKATKMQRLKYQEVVDIKNNELTKKQAEIEELQSKLKEYGEKYGMISYDIQIEELTKGYMRLVSSGKEGSVSLKEIKAILENFKSKGEKLRELSTKIGNAYTTYVKLKQDLDEAVEGVEKDITYYQLISSPYPADKKTYPVRWIIVILSAIGTFFMSLIAISVIESIKKNKNN